MPIPVEPKGPGEGAPGGNSPVAPPAAPPSGGAGHTTKKTKKPSKGTKSKSGGASNSNSSSQPGNQQLLVQPPFSPQTLAIPFPMQGGSASTLSQRVKKGYLQWDKTTIPAQYQQSGSTNGKSGNTKGSKGNAAGGGNKGKNANTSGSNNNNNNPSGAAALVNFQYNPSTTSYSSSNVGAQSAAAAVFSDTSDSSILTTPMQQTISFDLLFNRIYEVQGAYNTDGTPVNNGGIMDPATHGCWVDILAMCQFTGQLAGDNGSGKNNKHVAPPKQNNVNTNIAFQGPSFLIRAWLILGADDTCLYYGYVSDWSYQVAAWTQNMIPMTCVISVDFTLLPFNPSTTDQGPAAGGKNPWSLIPPGNPPSKNQPGGPNSGTPTNGSPGGGKKAPQPQQPVSGGNPPTAPTPPIRPPVAKGR